MRDLQTRSCRKLSSFALTDPLSCACLCARARVRAFSRHASTKRKLGIMDVEVAIGRLLRMGFTDEGRATYVSDLSEAEREPFDAFCRERVARHDDALSATLW